MTVLEYKKQFDHNLCDYIKHKKYGYAPTHVTQLWDNKQIFISNNHSFVVSFHPNISIIPSAKNITMHNHNFYEMAYVYKGRCTNYFENNQFETKEGEILLLNPTVYHDICTTSPNDCIVNILFNPELFETAMLPMLSNNHLMLNFFAKYTYQIGKSSDYLHFHPSNDPTIYQTLDSLVMEYFEKSVFYENICQSLLMILLSRLTVSYCKQIGLNPDNQEQDSVIISLLGYMQEHCIDTSLEQVADHFHYSTTHISRLLKKHTGKGFIEIMQNFKLEKIKSYLSDTDFTVENISQIMGYNDVNYLYKIFKNKYGITPNEYRKQFHQ